MRGVSLSVDCWELGYPTSVQNKHIVLPHSDENGLTHVGRLCKGIPLYYYYYYLVFRTILGTFGERERTYKFFISFLKSKILICLQKIRTNFQKGFESICQKGFKSIYKKDSNYSLKRDLNPLQKEDFIPQKGFKSISQKGFKRISLKNSIKQNSQKGSTLQTRHSIRERKKCFYFYFRQNASLSEMVFKE